MLSYCSAPQTYATLVQLPAPVVSLAHTHDNITLNKIPNLTNQENKEDPELSQWAAICAELGWYGDCVSQLARAIKDRGREYVAKAVEYCRDKGGALLRWGLFKGVIRFPEVHKKAEKIDTSAEYAQKTAEIEHVNADPIPTIFRLLKAHQVSDARLMLQRAGVSVERAVEVLNARHGLGGVAELRAMLGSTY